MANKAKKIWKHTVGKAGKNMVLADYCARHFPILGSKSAVKKALADGRLRRNGQKARLSDRLSPGDRLELRSAGLSRAGKFDMALETVYEDDWLLVVNKPGGIAVNGNRNKTVENAVVGQCKESPLPDALPRPVAVHRIDVPTNGLVMLAKTKTALIEMSKAFQDNRVEKEYLAVVHGKTPDRGAIDEPIKGKNAVTKFMTEETVPSRVFGHLSLLRLQLITGRTHQLRIHLQRRNHLIVGDKAYAGGQRTILGKGLMLCAWRMRFQHPDTGREIRLEVEAPSKFERLMRREEERYRP